MFRSLVTPEKFETIADLLAVSLLNIEDLPTLGFPIIATEEIMITVHSNLKQTFLIRYLMRIIDFLCWKHIELDYLKFFLCQLFFRLEDLLHEDILQCHQTQHFHHAQ